MFGFFTSLRFVIYASFIGGIITLLTAMIRFVDDIAKQVICRCRPQLCSQLTS